MEGFYLETKKCANLPLAPVTSAHYQSVFSHVVEWSVKKLSFALNQNSFNQVAIYLHWARLLKIMYHEC